jgi:hypothetical protein
VPIEGRHQALERPNLAVGPGAIEPPLLLTTLTWGSIRSDNTFRLIGAL